MNVKKIVMSGVLALGINHCHVQAGNVEPNWVKSHRYPIDNLNSATIKNYSYQGEINGYVHHGQFSNSIYDVIEKNKNFAKKIVIHQKKPCLVLTDDWNRYTNGYGGYKGAKGNKAIKIDDSTVVIERRRFKENGQTQTTRLGDYIRVKSVNSPKFATGKLVLGSSKQCLNNPINETWEVYWWLKNPSTDKFGWVKVAVERITK